MNVVQRLVVVLLFGIVLAPAYAQAPAALAGKVSSAEEGAMEGVLVRAKKAGSTITITVVSNAEGRYSFPAGRLSPGKYALKVRAAGYELDSPTTIQVGKSTTADLKLRRTGDLAAQLSNGEWITSMPGDDRQKGQLLNCVGCHTIEPHDVVGDKQGIAWYSSFGEQNLGRLDPKTGKVTEYAIKQHKPGFPTGLLGLREDRDGNLWLGNMYQAAIVKFDKKTQKFTYWQLPKEQNIDAAQLNMVSPQSAHVDGKVWTQNNGFAGVHRLDIATGKIETWEPFKDAPKGEPHNIYDVVPDSKNNAWFTDFRRKHIGRIDAKTGEIRIFEMPASVAVTAPRRGQMDAQDRLWFAQYRGDKIGMLDTKTGEFKDWAVGPRWSAPYDVAFDKNAEAWTGSMIDDQVTRLDTKTGTAVQYLLPRETNIRRVHVDNSTTPVTFWVGSNHGASIVKLEPLD